MQQHILFRRTFCCGLDDIIQVVVLVLGGLITTYLALDTVSGGDGFLSGLVNIYNAVPERFDMILEKSNPEYMNLPGIGVLIGGMWIANIYYWGFNQYIIQRTLQPNLLKNLKKNFICSRIKNDNSLNRCNPGIAAYVIVNDPNLIGSLGDAGLENLPTKSQADKAYPWLMQFLPSGLKGML